MQKTTLTIRTLIMIPGNNPKKITLHAWHDLTRDQAADIAVEFKGQNPHLQVEATYTTADHWHL